jgi:hypothetical protein
VYPDNSSSRPDEEEEPKRPPAVAAPPPAFATGPARTTLSSSELAGGDPEPELEISYERRSSTPIPEPGEHLDEVLLSLHHVAFGCLSGKRELSFSYCLVSHMQRALRAVYTHVRAFRQNHGPAPGAAVGEGQSANQSTNRAEMSVMFCMHVRAHAHAHMRTRARAHAHGVQAWGCTWCGGGSRRRRWPGSFSSRLPTRYLVHET